MEIAILPRWLMNSFIPRRKYNYSINILLSNLLIIIALFLFYDVVSGDKFLPNICLVDYFFGIECPFCGTTRSIGALYHGDLAAAWNYNRVAVLLGFYFLLQLPLRIFILSGNKSTEKALTRISKISSHIILILFFLNWSANLLLI